jgi:cytochrome c553
LQDWYIVRQLKNFKSGARGTKAGDTYGMQMRPMAMTLANDEVINNVAAYIATFK